MLCMSYAKQPYHYPNKYVVHGGYRNSCHSMKQTRMITDHFHHFKSRNNGLGSVKSFPLFIQFIIHLVIIVSLVPSLYALQFYYACPYTLQCQKKECTNVEGNYTEK